MRHPHSSDKQARIVAALNAGRSLDEVAAEFGVKRNTARVYLVRSRCSFSRPKRDAAPRCRCGLLLPCTCEEEHRSVLDYLTGEGGASALGLKHCGL